MRAHEQFIRKKIKVVQGNILWPLQAKTVIPIILSKIYAM